MQVGHGEANFTFPLGNYGYLIDYYLYSWTLRTTALYSVLFIITTLPKLRNVFVAERGITPTASSDNQRTRPILIRRLLCCIHDRLAFDDIAALTEGSCQLHCRQLSAISFTEGSCQLNCKHAHVTRHCQICACVLPLTARRGCGLTAPRSWI